MYSIIYIKFNSSYRKFPKLKSVSNIKTMPVDYNDNPNLTAKSFSPKLCLNLHTSTKEHLHWS